MNDSDKTVRRTSLNSENEKTARSDKSITADLSEYERLRQQNILDRQSLMEEISQFKANVSSVVLGAAKPNRTKKKTLYLVSCRK